VPCVGAIVGDDVPVEPSLGPIVIVTVSLLVEIVGDDVPEEVVCTGGASVFKWGSYPSLVVFLAMYFITLWVAWRIAVWLTRPKPASTSSEAA
jgi:hypothetical protein